MRAMKLAAAVRAWTVVAMALATAGTARAGSTAPTHLTDGIFDSPAEWDPSRSTVTVFSFPQVGNTGGANLYVEQSGGVLYLMYDYVKSPVGMTPSNATFDVFFQVPNDQPGGTDYVVSFTNSMFAAFEKPTSGPASSLNPDGSINLSDPVWSGLSSDDLARAGFVSAIGFGLNPATTDPPHLMAEFQLTIQSPNAPGGGFYDPSPAFWSASVSGGAGGLALDPPISSAIFQLNPDGTTIVTPVFGANGGPVLQPQDVPEPSSVALVGAGLAILAAARRRRRCAEA